MVSRQQDVKDEKGKKGEIEKEEEEVSKARRNREKALGLGRKGTEVKEKGS